MFGAIALLVAAAGNAGSFGPIQSDLQRIATIARAYAGPDCPVVYVDGRAASGLTKLTLRCGSDGQKGKSFIAQRQHEREIMALMKRIHGVTRSKDRGGGIALSVKTDAAGDSAFDVDYPTDGVI